MNIIANFRHLQLVLNSFLEYSPVHNFCFKLILFPNFLMYGDLFSVQRHGNSVRTGTVDEKTNDQEAIQSYPTSCYEMD